MTTVLQAPTTGAFTTATDLELSRFFQVAQTLNDPTGALAMMPAGVVDERWHQMIDDGTLGAFVTGSLGAGVTVEHIEIGGVDRLNWVRDYESQFGTLSPLWFTGADGVLDETAYAAYLAGNVPEMSWDCSPKMSWDCSPKIVKPVTV